MPKTEESRHALFRSDLALNARRIIARRLRLRQLDLQHLHLARELEHLVLDLAALCANSLANPLSRCTWAR